LQSKNELIFLLGGRSSRDLFGLKEFSRMGTVRVATNDGSEGHSGFITDLLAEFTEAESSRPRSFIACGPEPMVEATFKKLESTCDPDRLWGSIEYMTSCGVGICGKCACPGGLLTCIDGPFLQMPAFRARAMAMG
jgi:dihydroorotate dehydrogenase (NAD+) catalytic subunit